MEQKTDAFPHKLQLQYKIDCSLSNYQQLVEHDRWEFPSFEACCQICGAAGCAKFHGFYSREVVDEGGKGFEIWIARYLCHRKGEVHPGAHKTFSLLPHVLIPYKRYSAPLVYEVFEHSVACGAGKTLDRYQPQLENLCERSIFWIMLMFQAAFHLLVQAHFIQPTQRWQDAFISIVDSYSGGLPRLIMDLYVSENQFLFGTPSQKRKSFTT